MDKVIGVKLSIRLRVYFCLRRKNVYKVKGLNFVNVSYHRLNRIMRSAAYTVHILGLQKIVVPRRIVIRSGVNKSGEG